MPVSPESASSENLALGHEAPRLLIVATSWLGDGIMMMPALTALRQRVPHAQITVLAKPAVSSLWHLFPGADDVLVFEKGFGGTPKTVRHVRSGRFDFSYICPRSFRSAVIPFLAQVPGRRGLAGHSRDWMLTETIHLDATSAGGHQVQEYMQLFGVEHHPLLTPPFLVVPGEQTVLAQRCLFQTWQDRVGRLDAPRVVGFFPGAAHGPSKRWPAERFIQLGKQLLGEHSIRILVFGSRGDRETCVEVATGIGRGALNLAGETSLASLVAYLQLCRVVVSNDSGGMHLAAAVGTRVVGLFGVTDPGKTAPLGEGHRLILAGGVTRHRDLSPDSEAARQAMMSIGTDEVYGAVRELLMNPPHDGRPAQGLATDRNCGIR
jgi:heptosyltransferase-2